MSLSLNDVRKIANLARLELSEEALMMYQQQLSAVLDHVAMLDEVDLDGVEPTAHAVAQQNIMREDEIRPSLPTEAALQNAPKQQQNQFLIQTILDEG
jgi:aspartyl-tRNA(Asn)/glutamyl-tRNA(Gln) amidotransferase subunit C